MVAEGEERHSQVVGMEHHIDLVGLHTVLVAERRMVVVGEHRRAAVEKLHMVVAEEHRRAAVEELHRVVGEGHRMAVVEDSLAEEGIDWEKGRRKAVEGGSLAEWEDIGRSLAAGNLRGCQSASARVIHRR